MSKRPPIDLRSDTVTKPTPAMRRAMAEAEVGDDVYGEDPTINRLEKRAAEILGKEAALFVPTGTMGNTIAVKIHTEHGQEVICESHAHLLDWELSMTAWFSGCLVRPVAGADVDGEDRMLIGGPRPATGVERSIGERRFQEQFRETDKRFAEMIAVLDERIDKLVIAMGEFIRRNSNGRGKQ